MKFFEKRVLLIFLIKWKCATVLLVESLKLELERYFTEWEYSFYSLRKERIKHVDFRRFEGDMYCDEANIGAAAILLKKENQQDALQFIEHCLEKDPTNVHAWCNKGMYHLSQRPADIDSAQKAKDKMEDLLKKEEPEKEVIVETAYWLYVMDGSVDQKKKALDMFDSVLRVVETPVYPQHFAYIKVLKSKATSINCGNDEVRIESLQKLAQQLSIFSTSTDKNDEFAMWSFLIDILLNKKCKNLIRNKKVDFSSIQNLPPLYQLSPMDCVAKLLKVLKECTSMTLRSRFCSRIGKVFLNLAINERDERKRGELLKKALEEASGYESIPAGSYEHSPRICAQIILHQWGMSFCAEKREIAKQCYRKVYNCSGRELIS